MVLVEVDFEVLTANTLCDVVVFVLFSGRDVCFGPDVS